MRVVKYSVILGASEISEIFSVILGVSEMNEIFSFEKNSNTL